MFIADMWTDRIDLSPKTQVPDMFLELMDRG